MCLVSSAWGTPANLVSPFEISHEIHLCLLLISTISYDFMSFYTTSVEKLNSLERERKRQTEVKR